MRVIGACLFLAMGAHRSGPFSRTSDELAPLLAPRSAPALTLLICISSPSELLKPLERIAIKRDLIRCSEADWLLILFDELHQTGLLKFRVQLSR